MEVSLNVNCSLVETFIEVLCVLFELMSVNEIIDESQNFFLSVVYTNSLWIDIEREMIVSLNIHKVVVKVEHWEQ